MKVNETTFRKDKGITLIALVVTIIVLLILAGISINMLMGQNGILSKATTAKTQTESTNARDELALAITSLGMDYHINGQGGTFRDYIFGHEADLKKELGSDQLTLNSDENLITYKGKIFTVNEDGSIEAVDGIALTDTKKTLQIVDGTAEEATITANLINLDGSITWTADPTGIVSITPNGTTATIKAVSAGTTTITASCNGKTATCEVTVKNVTTATSLSLDKTTAEVEEGATVTLTATENGTEDIVWESKEPSKATVVANENNSKVATVTGIAKGTVEIVAKTKNLTATCSVTVKESSMIGQYLEYDVSYTDIYTTKEYTKGNGWRILHQKYNESAGIYDIDIISTGIPAGLYYYYNDVSSAPWKGTTDQQNAYVGSYYGTAGNNNVIAASGLLNNFASIIFKGNSSSSSNLGYYTKIKNGTEYTGEEKNGANLFIARSNATVRSVMHSDIEGVNNKISGYSDIQNKTTADTTGLFRLDKYTPDPHSSGYYWLASPDTSSSSNVYYVYCGGSVGGHHGNRGVRPVVSMSGVQLQKTTSGDTTLWKITN